MKKVMAFCIVPESMETVYLSSQFLEGVVPFLVKRTSQAASDLSQPQFMPPQLQFYFHDEGIILDDLGCIEPNTAKFATKEQKVKRRADISEIATLLVSDLVELPESLRRRMTKPLTAVLSELHYSDQAVAALKSFLVRIQNPKADKDQVVYTIATALQQMMMVALKKEGRVSSRDIEKMVHENGAPLIMAEKLMTGLASEGLDTGAFDLCKMKRYFERAIGSLLKSAILLSNQVKEAEENAAKDAEYKKMLPSWFLTALQGISHGEVTFMAMVVNIFAWQWANTIRTFSIKTGVSSVQSLSILWHQGGTRSQLEAYAKRGITPKTGVLRLFQGAIPAVLNGAGSRALSFGLADTVSSMLPTTLSSLARTALSSAIGGSAKEAIMSGSGIDAARVAKQTGADHSAMQTLRDVMFKGQYHYGAGEEKRVLSMSAAQRARFVTRGAFFKIFFRVGLGSIIWRTWLFEMPGILGIKRGECWWKDGLFGATGGILTQIAAGFWPQKVSVAQRATTPLDRIPSAREVFSGILEKADKANPLSRATRTGYTSGHFLLAKQYFSVATYRAAHPLHHWGTPVQVYQRALKPISREFARIAANEIVGRGRTAFNFITIIHRGFGAQFFVTVNAAFWFNVLLQRVVKQYQRPVFDFNAGAICRVHQYFQSPLTPAKKEGKHYPDSTLDALGEFKEDALPEEDLEKDLLSVHEHGLGNVFKTGLTASVQLPNLGEISAIFPFDNFEMGRLSRALPSVDARRESPAILASGRDLDMRTIRRLKGLDRLSMTAATYFAPSLILAQCSKADQGIFQLMRLV